MTMQATPPMPPMPSTGLATGAAPAEPAVPALFLSLDLETTGFGNGARIVEIAIIEWANGKPTGNKLVTLVDPGCFIPADATAVHGITDEMVQGKPRFEAIAQDVHLWVNRGVPIVGHNIRGYDAGLVATHLRQHNLEPPAGVRFIDTLEMARQAFPGQPNNAGDLAARLGIATNGAHRAEADALTCGYALLALSELGVSEQALVTKAGEAAVVTLAKRTVLGIIPRLGVAAGFIKTLRCENEEDLARCTEAAGRLRQIFKMAEASRKQQVEEVTKISGEVNALYRERIKKPIDAMVAAIDAICSPYQTQKALELEAETKRQNELKLQQQLETQRKAQEVTDRKRVEAENLRATAKELKDQAAEMRLRAVDDDAENHKMATELDTQAEAHLAAARVLEREIGIVVNEAEAITVHLEKMAERSIDELGESQKVNATLGSSSVEWEYFDVKVEDRSQVPERYWLIDMALVNKDLASGVSTIPGVTYQKRVKTKFRGK